MKRILFFLFLVASSMQAQIVNIPDPLFKQTLINQVNPVIDTNGDGEIQVSEAEATPTIFVGFSQFTDLTGIEAFINLEEIFGQSFQFTFADFSNNNNLRRINLSLGNLEQIIPPSQTANLEVVSLFGNNLTDVNFLNNYTNLEDINLAGNTGVTEIPVNNLTSLESLHISDTGVSAINLSSNSALKLLSIQNTAITNIDLSTLNLESLSFGESIQTINLETQSQLEVLRVFGLSLPTLDISANTALIELNVQNYPYTSIDVSNNSNLEIVYFVNGEMTALDFSNNSELNYINVRLPNMVSINVSNCSQLLELDISGAESLASIDVSNNLLLERFVLVGASTLDFSNNTLEIVDLSQNTALLQAQISFFDGITSLQLDGANSLQDLQIRSMPLTSVDVSNNNDLRALLIQSMPLDVVDISNLSNLEYFSLRYLPLQNVIYPSPNNIMAVTFMGTTYEELDFSSFSSLCWMRLWENLNLEKVNLSNIDLVNVVNTTLCIEDPLPVFGTIPSSLDSRDNPNLKFICVDDAVFATANFTDSVEEYVTFTEDCLLSGSDSNVISGALSYDVNDNDCSSGSLALPDRLVITEKDGAISGTITDSQGDYELNVGEGNYTTSCPNFDSNFEVNPPEVMHTFVGFGQTDNAVFCVDGINTINDLTVALVPQSAARIGAGAAYTLNYENVGTTQLNGIITLTYDDVRSNFLSANPAPTSQTANTVTWDLGVVNPLLIGEIDLLFNIPGDPINEVGDLLNFEAIIEPQAGDVSPGNNVFTLVDEVDPFLIDPFGLHVSQPEQILIEEADNYLHFSVSFDNPFSFPINDAVVYFSLSESTNIDFETIQLLSSSHAIDVHFNNDFFYVYLEDINLPPSFANAGGNEAHLSFRFKPVSTIQVDELVTFDVGISLDGILLEKSTSVQYVASLLTEEVDTGIFGLNMYPNPSNGIVNLKASSNMNRLVVYGLSGVELLSYSLEGKQSHSFNVSSLSAGVYLIMVESESGQNSVKRLIVE